MRWRSVESDAYVGDVFSVFPVGHTRFPHVSVGGDVFGLYHGDDFSEGERALRFPVYDDVDVAGWGSELFVTEARGVLVCGIHGVGEQGGHGDAHGEFYHVVD